MMENFHEQLFSCHFKDLHFLKRGWALQSRKGKGTKSRLGPLKRFNSLFLLLPDREFLNIIFCSLRHFERRASFLG